MASTHPELSISIIIPVYNGGDRFRQCLESLAKLNPSPLEIIVVSDGDTDESWKMAQDFGVTVVRQPVSRGPATARNIGAKMAKGDILFFVDADVTVYPDILPKVAKVFKSNPNVAALIGSYDDNPGESNFLSQYKNLFHHYIHQNASEEASTFWGACGAIRRQVFLEIGGFDQQYRRPSIEDIELGYRLKAAGYNIRLCKDIQVKHLKLWTPISLLKAEIFYRALPWTELIHRDNRFVNDLNLQWSSRISVILTYSLVVALMTVFWMPQSLLVSSLIVLSLLALNISVYRFFQQKRGWIFTLQVLFWHWLYYLYSGLAFAVGTANYFLKTRSSLDKLAISPNSNS
ncbi:glycosyl transferase family 2 [Gloeothece citriformis PCC 7424]|uniref:Glycosyl transferase family 2 n=1 Tax=Gloeothece citriformis (strain PCC 7424) TaxID=65393 RepID=B7KLJ3_GLOC7|nr:glycosyltransferase family 2 protein [Gloeothece citriformis]ACK72565.1 glycosyl transferase family 2 [Gloeothece citriformis PCC 7424]